MLCRFCLSNEPTTIVARNLGAAQFILVLRDGVGYMRTRLDCPFPWMFARGEVIRSFSIGIILVSVAFTSRIATAEEFKLEDGFKAFFNGKDLTGWKLRQGGASLDGKTATAKDRIQVLDGNLVIDGKAKGNLVIDTAHQFAKDVHIKFEFLPDAACNNDLYFRGNKFDLKKGSVKNFKPGEWHQFEIIVKGDKVEFKCNGESQRMGAAKAVSSLGVRAEFGAVQFRRMRFQE